MNDFAAYVFFVNREDLLQRAIASFPLWQDDLTIVDNSPSSAFVSPSDRYRVYTPPVPLTYAQTMNWMLKDATTRGVDFIAHFHSDAHSTNLNADMELLEYARRVRTEDRKWACLWSLYDVAWILNPVAARDAGGWDTDFPNYYTDQAMKQRWKRKGWETIDTHIQGVTHVGSTTVNSDPELKVRQSYLFPLSQMLYHAMYGGEPGHEQTLIPFNRPDVFK